MCTWSESMAISTWKGMLSQRVCQVAESRWDGVLCKRMDQINHRPWEFLPPWALRWSIFFLSRTFETKIIFPLCISLGRGVSDHGLIPFSEIPRLLHNSTPRSRLPDVCDGSRGTSPRGDGELVDWGAKCEENHRMWCNLTINLGWAIWRGWRWGWLDGFVCYPLTAVISVFLSDFLAQKSRMSDLRSNLLWWFSGGTSSQLTVDTDFQFW